MIGIVAMPEDFPRAFEFALNNGDLERIVALYDDQAVLRIQSNEIRSGSFTARAEMQKLIVAGAKITNTLRHTLRRGDIALIIVDYVLHLTTPDGSQATLMGTATNVIQHRPGEGWRMIIANPQGTA